MTDDHEPQDDPIDEVDELDELLSAHLDAELELLEDRPDLDDEIVATRLRELRGVADAVGASVPPVPASVIDDQIATALAALPTPAEAPASLTAARAAKRRPSRLTESLPALGAVAAVVLVLFGLGVVVANLDGGGESDDDTGDAVATEEAADFRRFDDEAESDTAAAEAAPEQTEAPAEAAGSDLDDSDLDDSDLDDSDLDDGDLADEGADSSDTPEAATDDTEAAATTVAPESGEADESGTPIELSEECTTDLLSRLEADELMSAVQRSDGTAEIVVGQGDAEVTVIIDPGLCNGVVDPILPEQP